MKSRLAGVPPLGMRFGVALLALIFVIAALELAVRIYDDLSGRSFLFGGRNLIARSTKKPVFPFRTFGVRLYREVDHTRSISSRHGELFPLQKPDDTYRIVVFGGSTSVNFYSVRRGGKSYPQLLQERLRQAIPRPDIEVISVANAGYSTPHSVILLALDVLSWQPDLLILSHNNNDRFAMYWPDFQLDYSNMYSSEPFVPYHASHFTVTNVLFQHLQIYWIVKKRLGILLDTIFARTTIRRESYGRTPPTAGSDVFVRNLRSFVSLARSGGIRVVLASQPLHRSEDYFRRLMAGSRANSLMVFPLHDEFVQHHIAFNEILREVAEETGAYFLDNDPALAGRDEHFVDYIHYTQLGVDQLAKSFCEFLTSGPLNAWVKRRSGSAPAPDSVSTELARACTGS